MSYDNFVSICQFINDDVSCLATLMRTNKEMRDIVINNTSYITQKDSIVFKKICEYTKIYSECKMLVAKENCAEYNQNQLIHYLLEIQQMIPLMSSSHLYDMNVIICENYIDYFEYSVPKFVRSRLHEESKMMYSIMKQIDNQYVENEFQMTLDEYSAHITVSDLKNWLTE